jgi:hypothetical protein
MSDTDVGADDSFEDLPGLLGYQWDDLDFYSVSTATRGLTPEFIQTFNEYAFSLSEPIDQPLTVDGRAITIRVGESEGLLDLLDKLPAVTVEVDCPANQGLAAGAGTLIFVADGFTSEQAEEQINLFLTAMESVLVEMKQRVDG